MSTTCLLQIWYDRRTYHSQQTLPDCAISLFMSGLLSLWLDVLSSSYFPCLWARLPLDSLHQIAIWDREVGWTGREMSWCRPRNHPFASKTDHIGIPCSLNSQGSGTNFHAIPDHSGSQSKERLRPGPQNPKYSIEVSQAINIEPEPI
jgi:hypothetical protein